MDECRTLYLKLVRQVHTDGAPDDEFSVRTSTMQQIIAAYKRKDLAALRLLESKMPPPSTMAVPPSRVSSPTASGAHQASTQVRPTSSRSSSRSFVPEAAEVHGPIDAEELTLEKLVELWPSVRASTKAINRRIEALLQQVNPALISGTKVVLVSQYEFHRNRVNTYEVSRVIEYVISDLVHHKIQITCVSPEEAAALESASR